MEGSTVLVVEDSDKGLKLVCMLLELRGYRAVGARSGREGVRLAVEQLPSLILMDIQLPDIGGIDALAQLRATPTTSSIPVVAVTALAMKGDRERLLAEGFDGYLSKPIDVRTFVDSVTPLIGQTGRHDHA